MPGCSSRKGPESSIGHWTVSTGCWREAASIFRIRSAPIRASIQRFKDDTNPVSEWARTMLEKSPVTKVERGDLLCAFQGWWRQEMGDDVRLVGRRWLFPKLRRSSPRIE